MVPQRNTPDDPTRALSAEVERALTSALRALATGQADSSSEQVREVVLAAGKEARERSLRPEELVLAFKRIEETAVKSLDAREHANHLAARSRVMQLLLQAYYRE
jgi:hypothetical protein